MLKKYILVLFSLCVSSVAVSQQNPLLEKYRSMAVEYSHDLKAADKNIAASLELEKAAQRHEIRCFRLPAATHIYGRTLAGDHTDGQVQA